MSDQSWKLLTAAELAPIESSLPFVLRAGLTPTWDAWRETRFAERDEAFASLWKAFLEWREIFAKSETTPREYLPVFWIEGAPGDGKSVLLLQLMAACLREHLAPSVAWLEHSPDGRAFQEKPPAFSGWGFCAEIPTRVEGTVRDNWMSELRNAGAAALVTSGSSEIRHGFEFHFKFCVRVTKFALPPFSLAEAVRFAGWFQARTENSRDAAALWHENISLTEFLFALHHDKPLAELTSDVRGALGNLGLGGRVRSVWLTNALGLPASTTLLANEAARNHAVKLTERGVVPVEVSPAGLRLAPPVIAWPLIHTWLGEGHQLQHLAEALAYILKAWLDAHDEKNAIRCLRQLWETEWLIDERPVGHGHPHIHLKRMDVLRELYRLHRRDFGGQPAPATIPIWLELNEAFSLMLLPDPVVCAAEIFSRPDNESRRTPVLAAITWLAADGRRAPVGVTARKVVAEYFANETGIGAGRALMRLVRDTKKISDARAVAEPWLKRWPDHPEALDVAGALVKRASNSEEFLAWVAGQFAQPSESRSGAPRLLAAMLEGRPHDETMRQQATAWAWSHVLEPETGIVWLTLLMEKLAKEDILRGVARWLAMNPNDLQADGMRERLLRHYPHAYEAAWVMQEWLQNHSADEQTPDLLLKLLQIQPNNRKVDTLVLEWINHSLTHPGSPKLLRLLLKHPHLAVQSAAERWFAANPNSPSNAELLSAFIHILPGIAKWIARGEDYASRPLYHGREHVVASLLTANSCQLRHVELALRLLPELFPAPQTFLEATLGRTLAMHPLQAEKVFREFPGTPHIPNLARALARGLVQIAGMRQEFVSRVLPVMDGEATFLTLCHLIRANVRTSETIATLLDWLPKHYRGRGYTPLLGALHNHPAVWDCLHATGRLDKRVLADFQNYRARPAEQNGET